MNTWNNDTIEMTLSGGLDQPQQRVRLPRKASKGKADFDYNAGISPVANEGIMATDWLKKAEEQRESGSADAEREAGSKAFFETSKGQVAAILSDLDELWKSIDLHRSVLAVVTTHEGHDFRVHVSKYQSPSGIELFLFDKSNMFGLYDKNADVGVFGFLSASVRVLIQDGHFVVYVTNGPGQWIDRKAQTIDELESVIADL